MDQVSTSPGFFKPTILLVDGFRPFRALVASILREHFNSSVICEASDGLEALQRSEERQPDLILLDIGLPELNGFQVVRQIRRISPKSKIIFLSPESSPEIVCEALALGARAYVLKSDVEGELLSAVYAVLEGEHYLSEGVSLSTASAR